MTSGRTSRSRRTGTAVSSPTMPNGALGEAGGLFRGRVRGVVGGDDVDRSRRRTASTRAATSAALRRGGFILKSRIAAVDERESSSRR